ncbi:MAG: histidine kinase dimerization/phospho-acceptor domain-containing protein, partial [Gemmatimonadota bacterium]
DPTGKLVTEAFPGIETDPFDWISTFGKVAKTGEEIRFKQHLQHNDRWYDCVGYQYKPDHFVAAFLEITEQKKAEAERESLQTQLIQAQKMESVGRLAGGVAHDFNNMLTVILGYAQAAMDQTDPSGPVHKNLQEVLTAARRSADLTRQLLTFARKEIIAPKVLDLNTTVENMLSMLRRLIGEDIDLVWHPGSGLGTVKADPSQIDQILVNLCVNAKDAIADVGKITIETGAASFDHAYCQDARVRAQEPGHVLEEDRLARARAPEHGDGPPGRDLQVELPEHEVGAERLRHPLEPDHVQSRRMAQNASRTRISIAPATTARVAAIPTPSAPRVAP